MRRERPADAEIAAMIALARPSLAIAAVVSACATPAEARAALFDELAAADESLQLAAFHGAGASGALDGGEVAPRPTKKVRS